MVVALITAQSTTGNLLLVLLGGFWLSNQKVKSIIIALPIMTVIVLIAMSSGEGRAKVNERWENWDKTINYSPDQVQANFANA